MSCRRRSAGAPDRRTSCVLIFRRLAASLLAFVAAAAHPSRTPRAAAARLSSRPDLSWTTPGLRLRSIRAGRRVLGGCRTRSLCRIAISGRQIDAARSTAPGKRKSSHRRKGSPWLNALMEQWGWTASRNKDSYDKAHFNRLLGRHRVKRATCAVAATASTTCRRTAPSSKN